MTRRLIILYFLMFLIAGCGYYEGVVQPTPTSYLSFSGNTSGAAVVIDDVIMLNLDNELRGNNEAGGKVVLFQIAPGKHKIIITRMGCEIVNRVIIIGDNATKEIRVP